MDDARTLWCGNISEKVTEELLYELFLQAAPLERVKIPTDKEGRKSNYAFITVKHEVSVPYVTTLLDGTSLFDKRIYVKRRYSTHGQTPNVGNVNSMRRNFNTNQNQNRSRDHNSRDESKRDNYDEVGHSNRHRNESPHNEYGSNRHHNYNSNRHNYNNRQGRNYHGKNYHDKSHSRYRY